MRRVKHHVAGLIVTDKPSLAVPPTKVSGTVAKETSRHHVGVESISGLLFCHAGFARLAGKFFFNLGTERLSCRINPLANDPVYGL